MPLDQFSNDPAWSKTCAIERFDDPAQWHAPCSSQPAVMKRRARVLVIEHQSKLGESLTDALTLWGYDVEVVANGPDGLRRFETERHDLVVTDFLTDGVTGFEIGGALRERDPEAQVVVVASAPDPGRGRAPGRGFTVLKRPFDLRDLRRAMDRCLRMCARGLA